MKAIEVKDLDFSYARQDVLKNVNLDLDQGDFGAIIGSNGAGKSTLLKLILGELVPGSGRVRIMGRDVEKDMAFPKLRYVPQVGLGPNSVFPASCREVVATGIYKGPGKKLGPEDKKAIAEAFSLVDMEGFEKRNIGRLSGGQRQRILLARSLVSKHEILVLDEPTAGIDIQTSRSFYRLLKKLQLEEGLTILVITHDLEKIHQYTNRVFCLHDGDLHELTLDEVETEVAHRHKH